MCAQAIAFARLRRLYFGAADPQGAAGSRHGARIFEQPTCHPYRPEVVGGVQESRAAESCSAPFSKTAASPSAAVAGRVSKLTIRASRHSTGENPWRPSAPFRSSSPMPPAAT